MKHFIYATATAMAISGMAWVGVQRTLADDTAPNNNGGVIRNAGDKIQNAIDNATSQPAPGQALSDRDMREVRDTLQTAVQGAITKGGFESFVDRFTKADRDRLGKEVSNDHPDLDGIVAEIQKDWQNKYHEDFKMEKPELVFNNAQFLTGDVSENARLAGETLPPQNSADANNKQATVVLQNQDGNNAKALTIHVIAEGTITNDWKIKIPEQMTYTRLHDNLSRELTAIKDSSDKWPSDVNEAYRVVTHHIMNAAYDTNTPAPGAAQ